MGIFILFITALGIAALLSSSLAYGFGLYSFGDWSSWVGWGGLSFFVFAIIGIGFRKTLESIVFVILKRFSNSRKYSETANGQRFDSKRRCFLQHSINIGIIAASGSLAFSGVAEGLGFPQVKKVNIKIENLHPDLEGFSIVQISDLHIFSAIHHHWVKDVVERVNSLTPDIIAVTGDIVDAPYSQLSYDVTPLAGLNARFGNYFVTGNHEYMAETGGVDEWIRELENLGLIHLLNNHRIISQDRGMMLIGGVADYSAPYRSSHDSSPAQAMGDASNANVKILLAHQPQSVYEAAQAGFDLQLSGHTHGGMFSLFRWLRSWSHPFQAGLYKYKNTQLYVNSGTGYWGIPLRYGTPPEITHLNLTLQKSSVEALSRQF
jgi:predicted MPP superfamily phosphohydrolase